MQIIVSRISSNHILYLIPLFALHLLRLYETQRNIDSSYYLSFTFVSSSVEDTVVNSTVSFWSFLMLTITIDHTGTNTKFFLKNPKQETLAKLASETKRRLIKTIK